MRNVLFLLFFLFCCWQANGQDYLQQAKDCFEKGDYECAKRNYTLFTEFDGSRDVSAQIQAADECFKTLIVADDYFKEQEYEKARDRYKSVLDKNPKDAYAKKQYDECVKQISASAIEMVYVQGGTFTMGCTQEQGNDCIENEKPAHQVTLSSYYIGKYEVTQAEWESVMGTNPSNFKGNNLPVESVSWDDVQEFIRKLNTQTGKQYRLPTEAEWEYAARGGNRSNGYKYSGSNTVGSVSWNDGESIDPQTYPVGKKSPNELGVYDLSGNVLEWCQDWYGGYSSTSQRDPTGPSIGSYHVNRGGSWGCNAWCARVSYRNDYPPDFRGSYLGFRLAYSLSEP